MALSATLSPRVLHFVHKSLFMPRPTSLVRLSVDRPNIFIAILPISKGDIGRRRDLDFIVPNGCRSAEELVPTLVFIDDKMKVCQQVYRYVSRLHKSLRQQEVCPIVEYSSGISENKRMDIIAGLRSQKVKIVVATAGAATGIDARHIRRVVQWCTPNIVNLVEWWQRSGRGGRDPGVNAATILFYNPSIEIPRHENHPMEIFHKFADKIDDHDCLAAIEAHDRGDKNVLMPNRRRAARRRQPATGGSAAVSRETSPAPSESGLESDILQESDTEKPIQASRIYRDALRSTDRAFIWLANTDGCQRDVVMRVLGNHDDWYPRPTEKLPCCIRCTPDARRDPKIGALLPPLDDAASVAAHTKTNPPGTKLSPAQMAMVREDIRKWRAAIWQEQHLNIPHSTITPQGIMPNEMLEKLVSSAHTIQCAETLQKAFPARFELRHSNLRRYGEALVKTIQTSVAQARLLRREAATSKKAAHSSSKEQTQNSSRRGRPIQTAHRPCPPCPKLLEIPAPDHQRHAEVVRTNIILQKNWVDEWREKETTRLDRNRKAREYRKQRELRLVESSMEESQPETESLPTGDGLSAMGPPGHPDTVIQNKRPQEAVLERPGKKEKQSK